MILVVKEVCVQKEEKKDALDHIYKQGSCEVKGSAPPSHTNPKR